MSKASQVDLDKNFFFSCNFNKASRGHREGTLSTAALKKTVTAEVFIFRAVFFFFYPFLGENHRRSGSSNFLSSI